jgi:hypothetical protein
MASRNIIPHHMRPQGDVLLQLAGGFSVEGGFGEDDMGSTMLITTPGHVRGFGSTDGTRKGMVKHRCREDFGRRLVDTLPTSFYITCPWLIGPSPERALCYDMQCAELPTGKGRACHRLCL